MGVNVKTGKNDNELEKQKQLISKVLDDLYEEIKHGDDEHQKWLKDEMEKFKNKKLDQLNNDE